MRLDVEDRTEWIYLKQHTSDDQALWDAVVRTMSASAEDVRLRLELLNTIAQLVTRPVELGGVGLPIGAELNDVDVGQDEVTTYYVFTIFDQLISRALKLNRVKPKPEHFRPERPGAVYLGGIPVVRSSDASLGEFTVSYLLRALDDWSTLPQVKATRDGYVEAEEATAAMNRQLDRIRMWPGFAPGSRCDSCPTWLT